MLDEITYPELKNIEDLIKKYGVHSEIVFAAIAEYFGRRVIITEAKEIK